MKKLRLDVEVLLVESFDLGPGAARLGTVAARSEIFVPDDGSMDCGGGGSAYTVGTCIGPTFCCAATWKPTCNSCEGSCGYSCGGTCVFTCRPGDACPG
ncbi:MAG TPA: hypothetical protein VGO40_17415 [Longimicrobium sp.]|jgi:hypothetical protein|nr:hypothetical protein [Longimicrobium sp.]